MGVVRHVGLLDNVKSRFKNNDEEEFERAFRDPSWPEGVEDFEPMTNTGSFLPATFDVDPLADASLPGNVLHVQSQGAAGAARTGVMATTESVVRPAGTGFPNQTPMANAFGDDAVPATQSDVRRSLSIVEPSAAPMPAQPASAAAAPDGPRLFVVDNRPSGYAQGAPRADMGDEGVHVYARQGERVARPTPPVESKPFADRLRERVAAANVSGQADETLGRSRAATQAAPVRQAPQPADPTDVDIDAELEERRSRRSQNAQGRSRSSGVGRDEGQRGPAGSADASRAGDALASSGEGARSVPGTSAAPVPISCVVVRPRSYDDVRDIIQGLIGEHRPVVMVLKGCSNDLARRILDVSFGLCCASGAQMREFGDHVYGVVPRGTTFTESDAAALRRQGIVLRG